MAERPDSPHPDWSRLAPPAGCKVLVAGGCGGLGRPLVEACLEIGLDVAVLDLPSAFARLGAPSGVVRLEADARDAAALEEAVGRLESAWGELDALVHLIGFAQIPPRPAPAVAPADWDDIFAVNVRSAHVLFSATVDMLRRRRGGSIVLVSSAMAYHPLPGFSAYAASKGALVSYTRAVAIEHGPAIRCNAVAMSAVETPFLAGGTGAGHDESEASWWSEMRERYVPTVPMQRVAVPDDLIGPVLFLAGPGATFVTGQVLHVNGGRLTA